MINIILTVLIVAALIAILLLLFLFKKPYRWNKEIKDGGVAFIFEASKDIKSVELRVKQKKGEIVFERKNIKKGERVEFNYELTDEKGILTVEDGGKKTYEV